MTITDPDEFKQRYPTAIPVTFEDEEFRSMQALSQHLAKQYDARPEAIRYWLQTRGADRQVLDSHFPRRAAVTVAAAPTAAAAPVYLYRGQRFSDKAALIRHLMVVGRLSDAQAQSVTGKLAAGNVTTDLDQAIDDRLALEAKLAALPAARVTATIASAAGNGGASNGADRVSLEEPSFDAVPEPIESTLTEISETIDLLRGAHETREAKLAELKKQLEAASDPALARKLADVENQLARQVASLKSLENQLARDHKSRAQISELVNLINRKMTQLAYDLKLEKIPTPTRRDPAAG
jgi:hypothetical protein